MLKLVMKLNIVTKVSKSKFVSQSWEMRVHGS